MFTLKRILAFVLSWVMKNAIYKKISLLSSIHKRGCLGFIIKKIEMPNRLLIRKETALNMRLWK